MHCEVVGPGPGGSPGFVLDGDARGADADEAAEGVFGSPSFVEFAAGVGQFETQALKTGNERHELARIVEDHHPDAADNLAGSVAHRQAHDHEGFGSELHDVEHDRLAAGDHAAHQAVGDHRLDRQADDRGRIGDAQTAVIFFVHPDDPGLPVDDQQAFGKFGEGGQEGVHGPLADELGLRREIF